VLGLCGGGYFLLSRPGRPLGPKVEKAAAQVDAGADDAGAGGGAKTASASAKAQDKGSPKKPGVEGLSDDDLKDLLSSHESALSKCYDKALKKDSSLSGKVLKVDIEVTAKGKASDVALDGPDSDGKLGKCVGKVIKKWKFPKGPAKKPYKARFPLSIK